MVYGNNTRVCVMSWFPVSSTQLAPLILEFPLVKPHCLWERIQCIFCSECHSQLSILILPGTCHWWLDKGQHGMKNLPGTSRRGSGMNQQVTHWNTLWVPQGFNFWLILKIYTCECCNVLSTQLHVWSQNILELFVGHYSIMTELPEKKQKKPKKNKQHRLHHNHFTNGSAIKI